MRQAFNFTVFALGLSVSLQAQQEFRRWYFGLGAGLDYSTTPPTVLTDNALGSIEGMASVCDGLGNLLFYSEGTGIANSAHTMMSNGGGLNGHPSSTQAVAIVKQPGNTNLYYVFTEGGKLSYSIVDMNLAAGLGSVTAKNVTLCAATCEKQVAARHCNGRDVWIVTHVLNAPEFRAFLLTPSGINTTAVVSTLGETPNTYSTAPGHLKISPDGKKLAMATFSNSVPATMGSGGLTLFDFDASSGIVSNSLSLLSSNYAYGVEFSPDGKKLYCARNVSLTTGASSILYQWDICNTSTTSIIASEYTIGMNIFAGAVQKAIDGKLYIAATGSKSLSVIHNPNASGAAMNFALNDLSIAPNTSGLGLPNYINTYQKPHFTGFTSSVSCQQISVSAPAVPAFTSGCGGPSFQPAGYLWDFNDPSSGAENTSSLSTVKHTFSALGTYTVKLIMYSSCTNDTLTQVVTISTPGPSVNLSGNFSVCKGDRYTYSVSGSGSYSWSANATSPTVALSPTATTAYTVSGTTNGCTLSKIFTVNVTVCTDVEKFEMSSRLTTFPVPFSAYLDITAESKSFVRISDLNGKIVHSAQVEPGVIRIDTQTFLPGMYLLESSNQNGSWRKKIIKTE